MRGFTFPTRELVSQQESAMIERADVPRSRFLGSWTRLTTFDAGHLVPFLLDEVLPGDHLKYDVTAYVRMATPLFPLMQNQRIDTFFFFVPNRLVWTNWVRFMGEQPTGPGQSIAFTVPILNPAIGGWGQNTIYDHFGLPTFGQMNPAGIISVSALPLRAYDLIYNEWFRDENLETVLAVDKSDGPDANSYLLRYRAKQHDYFTSCLPWPQKFVAPSVPFGGLAPVRGIGFPLGSASVGDGATYEESGGQFDAYAFSRDASITPNVFVKGTNASGINDMPQVFADLSLATGLGLLSVNTIRQALLVQQLLERDARGGTRYTELVLSHFGVRSPDMRLQRPEYIGGGSTPLVLTPIAQTSPTAGVPLGALGAAGTSVGQHSANYAATEHGMIIGLINVRSELAYQQGLHRMWSRSTRYDFYWPSLAGLGEQAVLRKEIYALGDNTPGAGDATVFGYQERWHEYRTRYSEITGKFKSTSTGTLDAWHLAQRFTTAPVLNPGFIFDIAPMARVLSAGALEITKQYLADILIRREAVRPIPMFGTPVTLGRF